MKINWGTGTDMTRIVYSGMAVAALLLAGTAPGLCQQYLYAPTAVSAGQQVDKKDGVLVEEVEVKKGDTLYGLSRRLNGRGMYYPQILLFNSLDDPNKIYPGNVLKIPVARNEQPETARQTSHKDAAAKPAAVTPASIELSTSDLKKPDAARDKKREVKKKTEPSSQKTESAEKRPVTSASGSYPAKVVQKQAPSAQAGSAASQKLFEQAVKAFRQDDFRLALELFDRFLAENPSSPLAPDASLFKAECYLKQSAL
jgi:TolA-binding protein